jgi:hypothetical protein
MNDLDGRLSAWNPVREADLLDAAASPDAANLLGYVLSQPSTATSRRRASQPVLLRKAWLAAAAAVAVAAAGIGVYESVPGHRSAHTVSSGAPVIGFQQAYSQGLAANEVELVNYATRAAAMTPASVPGPRDWMYMNVLEKGPFIGPHGYDDETWTEVGTGRVAIFIHGKLSYGYGCGTATQDGWPGSCRNLYQYLAALPVKAAKLRHIVLANNHSQAVAAFGSIMFLMNDFPLPARFQAELYAVLASLPGVRFDRSVADAAGRRGIGLYVIQDGLKREVIINPRTYAYMGLLWVAVEARTQHGTSPSVFHQRKGSVQASNAILGSGIVTTPGQLP